MFVMLRLIFLVPMKTKSGFLSNKKTMIWPAPSVLIKGSIIFRNDGVRCTINFVKKKKN